MTRGLFKHYLAIATTSPVYWACALAAALMGALSTLYPVGLRAAGSASGAFGGASLGVGVAAVLLPFATVVLLLATVGADEDLGLVEEFRLSGIPTGDRLRAGTAATLVAAVSALWPAPVVGALSGFGDAVRTSSPLMGSVVVDWRVPLVSVFVAGYFLAIGLALLVLWRNTVHVAIGLPLGFGVFVMMLTVFFEGNPVRSVLRLAPFAPVWSTLLPEGHHALVMPMEVSTRLFIALAWTAAALGVCAGIVHRRGTR